MPRRLPSLTSLRSFEAAGRCLSFTKAAEELTVTQAAISHQVIALEEQLGIQLFIRLPRKLELTKAGSTLLPVLRDSFDRIGDVVTELKSQTNSTTLSVRLAPSFAAKWLSPRLEDFRARHPEIDLVLYHSNAVVDFAREEIDIAVTYGNGDWPGVVVDPILSLDFFPVCSPAFMIGDRPLSTIDNLRHCTLLHDSNYRNWSDWFALAGLHDVNPKRGTIVDDTNVLMQAAVNGLGVALGSGPFVNGLLERGRLVRPFDLRLRTEFAYFSVCPREHLKNTAVLAFRKWLLGQADFASVPERAA